MGLAFAMDYVMYKNRLVVYHVELFLWETKICI